MPIKYKLIQRKNFSKDAQPDDKLYYASILSNGTATFEEVCESIAEETALTSADVKSCLDRLPRILTRHLREGRNVQLGEFGSFRLTLGSSGVENENDFKAATMMKRPGIVFTPGKTLQEMRDKVTYIRVKSDGSETSESGTPGGV